MNKRLVNNIIHIMILIIFQLYGFIQQFSNMQLNIYFNYLIYILLMVYVVIFGYCLLLGRVNKVLMIYILSLVFSISVNVQNLATYVMYILFIITYYIIIENLQDKFMTIYNISIVIILIFIIIFCGTGNLINEGYKEIGGIQLSRYKLDGFVSGLSFVSEICALNLMFSIIFKNKKLQYIVIPVCVILIVCFGKVSILGSLLATIMFSRITLPIIKKGYLKSRKRILLFSCILVLIISFSSYLMLYVIIPLLKLNTIVLEEIFTGRLQIWNDFINYIKNGGINLVLGYGFVSPMKMISIVYHPHNQYLCVLYSTGIVGFLVYICIWIFLVYQYCILYCEVNDYSILLILYILFMQIGDDYFVLTTSPMYFPIIIYYLSMLKYKKNKDKKFLS